MNSKNKKELSNPVRNLSLNGANGLNIGIFGFGNMGQAIFDLLKYEKNFKFNVYDIKKSSSIILNLRII